MADFFKILQQAQQMQGKLQSLQEELAHRTVHGSAGGGLVSVEADGKGQVKKVKIEVEKKIVSSSSMLIPFAPTLFTLQPFIRDTAAQRLETPPVPPPRRTSV